MLEKYDGDKYEEMMRMYQERGGTAQEFVQKLYSVSRNKNIEAGMYSPSSKDGGTPGSVSSSGVSGSGSQRSQDQEFNRRFELFNLDNWKKKDSGSDSGTADHHHDMSPVTLVDGAGAKVPDTPTTGYGSSRKRSIVEKTKSSKRIKTDTGSSLSRLGNFSVRDDSLSSSDESGTEENQVKKAKTLSTERHKTNQHKFSDQELWRISGEMLSINWRAVGRTLGLDEPTLVNLEHNYKTQGVRECVYQMMLEWKEKKPKTCTLGSLYTALYTEKMHNVAKNLIKMHESGHFKN